MNPHKLSSPPPQDGVSTVPPRPHKNKKKVKKNLELFDARCHTFELFCVGVSRNLLTKNPRNPSVALPERKSLFSRFCDQFLPRIVQKGRICRIGHAGFHNGCVGNHSLKIFFSATPEVTAVSRVAAKIISMPSVPKAGRASA